MERAGKQRASTCGVPARAAAVLPILLFTLGLGCAASARNDRASGPVAGSASDPAAPAASGSAPAAPATHAPGPVELPAERHLHGVRKLTSGGENAEAYWSCDGSRLVYQSRHERPCDDIWIMGSDGSSPRRIAADGAHTCGFFLKGDARVLFSSTMQTSNDCPPPPDRSHGYAWAIRPDYDIYTALPDGSDVKRLTDAPGYDAESTVGPDGRIVFTSTRDGDLDVYVMQPDGTGVRRLTHALGYDGGPVFSPDGTKIAYRADHPTEPAAAAEYSSLLASGVVRPSRLEIWIMDADGAHQHPITSLGHAAFAPTFTPDGRRILFASNHADPKGRDFDLYLVGIDGGPVERVTFNETFDGFPMFSPDGKRLAFCSNRGNTTDGETNVFVADWIE